MLLIGLLAGLLLGAALAAAVCLSRAAATRRALAQRDAELERVTAVHTSELAARDERLELQAEHHARELEAAEARIELVRGSREQLRDEMKAVSADVLKSTGEQLTREIAAQRKADQERAAGELARRTEEIRRVVEPIGDKLGKVEGKVEQLERLRTEADGRLGEQIRALHEGVGSLAKEAGNLTSALKRPNTRGSWGEIQLRNVIEMAGMLDHCDFTEQTTVAGDEGRLRPDVLVRLPGGKLVVVDSKVPLDAFLSAHEAESDDQRELELARHARQTRDHVTKLASKGYQSQFATSPELVVMFVPSEGVYHAALAADPALIEYAVDQHVLIATPMTLIGLLRAIHYGWRQELIAESAREIAEIGRELHRRIATFAAPLAKAGRQLNSAVVAYNDAVGSFDRRVVPQLRKIEDAGAGSARSVPPVTVVEETARPLTSIGRGTNDETTATELVELADVRVLPAAADDDVPRGSSADA